MKNKKLIMYIGIVLLLLIIVGIGFMVHMNIQGKNKDTIIKEYTPQQEITDEQLRKTIVSLYFLDIETQTLIPEPRQVDSTELIENPYYFLVQLLIAGPKNESMIGIIPPGTILNDAKIIGNVVYLDFSEELIRDQNLGIEQETKIIKSIVNTLTELIEVSAVSITINGQENMGFPDEGVMFLNPFTR